MARMYDKVAYLKTKYDNKYQEFYNKYTFN